MIIGLSNSFKLRELHGLKKNETHWIRLKLIEQVSQVTAGPAKSAMMTSKNGKMQPTPLSPLFDESRL
jgi:hypothetical protein